MTADPVQAGDAAADRWSAVGIGLGALAILAGAVTDHPVVTGLGAAVAVLAAFFARSD